MGKSTRNRCRLDLTGDFPSRVLLFPSSHPSLDTSLATNPLKVYGTHNSYHRRTNIPVLGKFWKYEFPSIHAQLDTGVRHLELDVHYDWKTGR